MKSLPTLETVSISIKVVKIGSKQMTIAVFRQLEVRFPDLENQTSYEVWGYVRQELPEDKKKYHRAGDWIEHHAVWTDGKSVYRFPCIDPVKWNYGKTGYTYLESMIRSDSHQDLTLVKDAVYLSYDAIAEYVKVSNHLTWFEFLESKHFGKERNTVALVLQYLSLAEEVSKSGHLFIAV